MTRTLACWRAHDMNGPVSAPLMRGMQYAARQHYHGTVTPEVNHPVPRKIDAGEDGVPLPLTGDADHGSGRWRCNLNCFCLG